MSERAKDFEAAVVDAVSLIFLIAIISLVIALLTYKEGTYTGEEVRFPRELS